nr:HAMP domain-containing sensor histidine kinase [Actinomadura sp. WMMB 499]
MLVGLPLLLAVVAGVTWLVTRRALHPVEAVRAELAEITVAGDLSRRVPVPEAQDEVGRLAVTTNATLAALEDSTARQRAFVADASHELRSPIASLRTQLEVAAAHPELLDLEGAVHDVVRLQHLAADLLLLARIDAGERPPARPVRLAELVRDELGRRTADRVPVRASVTGDPRVTGVPGRLSRVLRNLLDNAERHADRVVRLTVERDGPDAVLRVADDGPGVPAADRERVFERFVRLDDARTRDEGGAGLGLAIARDLVAAHGGTLTVRDAPEGGALFEVRLPAAGPAPPRGLEPLEPG